MRRIVFAVIAIGIVAVVAIGLSQSGGGRDGAAAQTTGQRAGLGLAAQRERLRGSPPALARLHDRGGRLLPATPTRFLAELRRLRGHPVVVNGWASWCGPCRYEFPFLQQAAVTYGRRVGFVGLNATDNHGDAQRFLAKHPVSYPSYEDPAAKIARALHAPNGLPFTIFYDARGRLSYLHQGAYATAAKLEADIRRYAIDG